MTTYSSSVAVFGPPMPRASIDTNHARHCNVNVERLIEMVVMEVHVKKAVLHCFAWRSKCNWCNKWK